MEVEPEVHPLFVCSVKTAPTTQEYFNSMTPLGSHVKGQPLEAPPGAASRTRADR